MATLTTAAPRRLQPWRRGKSALGVLLTVLVLLPAMAACDTEGSSPGAAEAPAATKKSGPTKVLVPSWKGKKLRAAERQADQRGLVIKVVERRPSQKPPNTVINQSRPPGAKVREGAVVRVIVTTPFPRVVRVVGETGAAATRELRRAGFDVERTFRTVTSGSGRVVLEQTPAPGTRARPGSTVRLVVSQLVPAFAGGGGGGGSDCTPGYVPCLAPASDYDCAGGSGNGPKYVYGTVKITGSDPYGLDADGDGYGCD
jgi:hypothetical protein